jgi:hypothetical protein
MYSAVKNETAGAVDHLNEEKGKNLQRITLMVEMAFTIIITFVIGFVSKNIVEKKLRQ